MKAKAQPMKRLSSMSKSYAGFILALAVIFPCASHAQVNRFPPINWYDGDPTGVACTINSPILQSTTTGFLYSCNPSTSLYRQVAAGGLPVNDPTFTGTLSGPVIAVPNVDNVIYARFFPGVVCDGTNDDTAGLEAAINAAQPGEKVLLPGIDSYPDTPPVTHTCVTTSPLNVTTQGIYMACDAPNINGGPTCKIINKTAGPVINVSVPGTIDPLFTFDGIGCWGDNVQDLATIDCLNIASDNYGDVDSVIKNSFFANVRNSIVTNGRNVIIRDSEFAEVQNVLTVNNTGDTSTFRIFSQNDLRGYTISGITVEASGGRCGLPSTLFKFPKTGTVGAYGINIHDVYELDGWYSYFIDGNNMADVSIDKVTRQNAFYGLGQFGGTTYNLNYTNSIVQGLPVAPSTYPYPHLLFTSGIQSCNLDQDGLFAQNLVNANLSDLIIRNVARNGINITGTTDGVSISDVHIFDASQQTANTYDGISYSVGHSSTNTTVTGNTVSADSTSYFRYGIANNGDGATNTVFNNQITNFGTAKYLNTSGWIPNLFAQTLTGLGGSLTLYGDSTSSVGVTINTAGQMTAPSFADTALTASNTAPICTGVGSVLTQSGCSGGSLPPGVTADGFTPGGLVVAGSVSTGAIISPETTANTATGKLATKRVAWYFSYGNSLPFGVGASSCTQPGGTCFVDVLDTAIGSPTLHNYAVSSRFVCDAENAAFNTANPDMGQSILYTSMSLTNDAINQGIGAYENVAMGCDVGMLTWLGTPASLKTTEANIAPPTNWSADTTYSQVTGWQSTTNGAVLPITYTTTVAGQEVFLLYRVINTNGGFFTYADTGGAASGTAYNTTSPAINSGFGTTTAPFVIPLTNVNRAAGSYTVTITVGSTTGAGNVVAITALALAPATLTGAPVVRSAGVPRWLSASLTAEVSEDVTAKYDLDARQDVQLVQQNGLQNVQFVDIRNRVQGTTADMNTSILTGTSILHFNDAGHAEAAQAFLDPTAIRPWPIPGITQNSDPTTGNTDTRTYNFASGTPLQLTCAHRGVTIPGTTSGTVNLPVDCPAHGISNGKELTIADTMGSSSGYSLGVTIGCPTGVQLVNFPNGPCGLIIMPGETATISNLLEFPTNTWGLRLLAYADPTYYASTIVPSVSTTLDCHNQFVMFQGATGGVLTIPTNCPLNNKFFDVSNQSTGTVTFTGPSSGTATALSLAPGQSGRVYQRAAHPTGMPCFYPHTEFHRRR